MYTRSMKRRRSRHPQAPRTAAVPSADRMRDLIKSKPLQGEAFDDEWTSTSGETPAFQIQENCEKDLDDLVDTGTQRSNYRYLYDSFPTSLSKSSSWSGQQSAGDLVITTPMVGTAEDSSAEWFSTSDDSHFHTTEDYPDENRPASTPVSTEVWTITPKAWFFRDDAKNEESTDLCSQCSQIDFKAIFSLDPQMIGSSGNRTCSFSGLSRTMLISRCPACRAFATTVYNEYNESNENALNLSIDKFEGHLVAQSSGELCGYGITSDFLTNQSVILKIELLMIPMPLRARPWDSFRFLRPYGSQVPRWEYAHARGIILPAAIPESAHIAFKTLKTVKGFCFGIPLEERVNHQRISTMLHRCQKLHPECCTKNGLGFPQNARVVDCETRRVVSMVDGLAYFALSYVWGSPNDAGGSRPLDKVELSDCLPQVLPQMIEDALNMTVRLGHRYLWIDFFCIDQCHSADKRFQIKQMANIYSHASATICALGAHPELGLPGVSRSRPVSESFRSQDVTYIRIPEPDSLRRTLRESVWITRGWTFQEAILSQRCLFFTDKQASLVCHTSHQTETISQLADDWLWGSNVNIFTAVLGDEISEGDLSFGFFVNHYQGRHLSYELDALDAFKGLLSLAPTQSYFGILLPRSFKKHTKASIAFAYGLLWQVDDIEERPRELRANFPSWSWVSIKHVYIDSSFIGERYPDEEIRYKQLSQRALCMWVECSTRTWVPRIYAETLDSDPILIEDLFHRYSHMKVIPEKSRMLRLESFTISYQILKIHYPRMDEGRRGYADVKMETSNNLPFEWPNPDDAQRDHWYDFDKSYVKYLYDDISSTNEPKRDPRLAVLLVDDNEDGFNPKSYWLALRLAHDENGRHVFYREGIIKVCGRLKWKKNWKSAPRDEVWLI